MRDVTFGITAFERPFLLSNLVRSIRQRYPLAKIVVADNSQKKITLPESVQHLHLPFDCGLSTARNALIDTLTTKYLLLLEDDFLFTDDTTVEPLIEVLEADKEVGVVGGAIRSLYGRVTAYALDIEVFRDTMSVREAPHRVKFTPSGLPYRLCDMVWNFALFRKAMLAEHRWDDRLKIGEHCPYFHQVKLAARWRVAACTATRIDHQAEPRSKHYVKYRQRAKDLFNSYLKQQGIERFQRVLPYHFEDDEQDKPCLVVLGVGHSGTTVLSKMFHALGWNAGDADAEFGESCAVRQLNQWVEKTGQLPHQPARRLLESLPRPWIIKDPRFVKTLHQWTPLFQMLDRKPMLLRVRRDRQSMLASYARRGAPGEIEQSIDQQLLLCRKQYEQWPWQRMSLEYELLAAAVSQFDMDRYHAGAQRGMDTVRRRRKVSKADPQHLQGAPDSGLSAAAESDSGLMIGPDGSAQWNVDGSGAVKPEEFRFRLDPQDGSHWNSQ